MKKHNYKEITVYELNLLYLELKYRQVSLATYGAYQDRAKVINEYLGNYKVKNITSSIIDDFHNYMKNNKKWSYSNEISNITINNIMNYLYTLLNKAIFWHIIPEDFMTSKDCKINLNLKSKKFIKEQNDLLLDIEQKRISEAMNNIFSKR